MLELATQPPWGRRLRAALILSVMLVVIVQIVILSPSTLDQPDSGIPGATIDPGELIRMSSIGHRPLAPGIPPKKIAEYMINRFSYTASQGTRPEWKLLARRAFLYNHEKIVHAATIHAFLYDPDGKATEVHGLEAKYLLNGRDLEIFGDVETRFPDGSVVHSDYLRYLPGPGVVEIPDTYPVSGTATASEDKEVEFESKGMKYEFQVKKVFLPKEVVFVMSRKDSAKGNAGVPETTTIHSDRCLIDRNTKTAHFTMNPARPLKDQFVVIDQPRYNVRSRTADLNYGDYSELLHYLVARDDVFIRELTTDGSLQYGTCGLAEFDVKSNVIVLTKFPQFYQDADTVTGETIVVEKDTGIIEVKYSNAFSEGSEEKERK